MPSHYNGTEEEILALSALITLMRASDAFGSYMQRNLASKRLTLSQFGTLEALLHRGTLHQGELASKLLRSCGSITAVVSGLEKRGLVRRERTQSDRRFVKVSLTQKGRNLIEGMFPAHAKTVTGQFQALTQEEQQELRRLCRKLGKAVAAD